MGCWNDELIFGDDFLGNRDNDILLFDDTENVQSMLHQQLQSPSSSSFPYVIECHAQYYWRRHEGSPVRPKSTNSSTTNISPKYVIRSETV
jgi:hypothetical protein